jgi:hypothetical protein
MAAVPSRDAQRGLLRRTRTGIGTVLIRMGTFLQAEAREPGAPHTAFHTGAP